MLVADLDLIRVEASKYKRSRRDELVRSNVSPKQMVRSGLCPISELYYSTSYAHASDARKDVTASYLGERVKSARGGCSGPQYGTSERPRPARVHIHAAIWK